MKNIILLISAVGVFICLSNTTINYFVLAQEPDFILELENVTDTKVIEFKINNQAVKDQLCPSNQCTLEYNHTSPILSGPDPTRDFYAISYGLPFIVHDEVTNKDLSPIQKKFTERYEVPGKICKVENIDDIIEQDGNVKYKCEGLAEIIRIHDYETWLFESTGVYDSNTENFKLVGKFLP